MANASVSFLGAVNQTESTLAEQRELFLKIFAGEIITQFEQKCTALDKHFVRTITHGKSASFPVMGRFPDAEYHTPGTEITGQKVNHNEKIIAIDGLLISHAFIADLDDAMNHYDVRSRYASEMGNRLAYTFDNNVYRNIVLGARGTAAVTDGPGGSIVTEANLASATDATKLAAWMKSFQLAAQYLDEKEVPEEGRYCAVAPAIYHFLVSNFTTSGMSLINKDIDGKGSISEGKILKVQGINLVKTNNLPKTDLSADTYHPVNASTTQAVVWTEDAVGTVKLMDLSLQSEWDIRRQGTLMVARYAVGHGVLRPECAVEFRTAAPA